MNIVILCGRLTRDVEVKYSRDTAFARVSIAIDRKFSKEKITDFFNLVAFGKTAEFMGKYMHRGERVLIEGRLQTSKYKDKDGNDRTSTEVVVENAEFADGGNKKAADPNDPYGGTPVDDRDTPF